VASLYANYTDSGLFGDDVWALIQQGKMIAAHEYVNAQRIRTLFRRDFDALWQKIDVLASPTTPISAPRIDEITVQIGSEQENTRMASTRLVRAINFLGEPALSMPCGKSRNNLPIGLQLIARPFTEPKLLRIAQTLEPMMT
jgi:aspartyl-tRNA(Asn)/glutamyl-tRNA(Gln) amidotransferase subunit A